LDGNGSQLRFESALTIQNRSLHEALALFVRCSEQHAIRWHLLLIVELDDVSDTDFILFDPLKGVGVIFSDLLNLLFLGDDHAFGD